MFEYLTDGWTSAWLTLILLIYCYQKDHTPCTVHPKCTCRCMYKGTGNPGYTTYVHTRLGLVGLDCKGGCRKQGWDLCMCILTGLRRVTLMISYQAGLDCPAINNLYRVQLYNTLAYYTQWHVN